MEVVISKVEELKVLIDSATERVKGSSVHCLQELLHHLVTFYSTQRFVFVSLVVVDTKTGKEQRFYKFRDLLDHSKRLLNQTGQTKNPQNSQYLERVLGNRADENSHTEPKRNVPGFSSQHNSQSQEQTINHGRQAIQSYTSQRTDGLQQQYNASCPQPGIGYLDAGQTATNHTARSVTTSVQQDTSVAYQARESDAACLQKDGSDYIHRLLTGPQNSVPVASTTSHSFVNYQYNNSTIGVAPLLQNQNSGHHTNPSRDHQLTLQLNEQSFTDSQPRSTVGQYVVAGHHSNNHTHYSIATVQSQGHGMNNNNFTERREDIVLNTEQNSFNLGATSNENREILSNNSVYLGRPTGCLQSVAQPMPEFPALVESTTLYPSPKSQLGNSDGVRSLRGLVGNDANSSETCNWSSAPKSQQIQRKQANNVPNPTSQPFTEQRQSFTVMSMPLSNSESVDLTGSSKGNADITKIPEVEARRSLSRMTNPPVILSRQLMQDKEDNRTVDSPRSSAQSDCWSSCRKEPSTLLQKLVQVESAKFGSQTGPSHRFNSSQLDKDQALNALLAKKLSEGITQHEPGRPTATSAGELNSRHVTNHAQQQGAEQFDRNTGNTRNLRSTRRSAPMSRRKSSSPQKITVSDTTQANPALNDAIIAESSDDGSDDESVVEIITSDSSNDECIDHESSRESTEPRKKKSSMKYYCFYCNDINCKVSLKDLLHHLKDNHLKMFDEKKGLPCQQCGKLFNHKTQGADGMYSTMLACLNHMMCQHSSPVPDYMKVHKCGQCSFVSLIKTIVKRHEQCHKPQDSDSHCDNTWKKLPQQDHQANASHSNDYARKEEHSCTFCKKKYSSKSALAIHIERKHKNINSFLCSMCPSSFYAKVDLERHMYAQHSVNISKRAVIKCPHCDYQSLEGSLMRKHIKNHQTGSFVCDICSKEFGTENRLKSHRMIHTAERKYKCDDCDYATAKRYHFERHVAVRHKGQFWKCSSCSMLTFNKNNLQKHINKVHQGNAEIKEVDNLKDPNGDKKNKNHKKKAHDAVAKKTGNSNDSHQNVPVSSVALFVNPLDINNEIIPAGSSITTNFQETIETDSEKFDSALGIVLDQESPGLLAMKSPTLLWQLQ